MKGIQWFMTLVGVFCSLSCWSQNVRIYGTISDSNRGSTLVGAHVFLPSLGIGTTTNEDGFYQIFLPTGEVTMRISYVGYDDLDTSIILSRETKVDLELRSRQLKEVRIVAEKLIPFHRSDGRGGAVLSLERAQYLPSFTGYPDPVKTSIFLPGVSASRDGNSRIVIRGSEYDHHMLAVDGVALPEYSHLFGLMSVMNPDMVQDIRVYKSGMPQSYSNMLGGVIDARLSAGTGESTSNFILGLLNSGYQRSGSLGKGSYNIGGRLSYFDIINLYPAIKRLGEDGNNILRFADAMDLGIKTQHPFLSGSISVTLLGAFSNLGSRYKDVSEYSSDELDNSIYKQKNIVGLGSIRTSHQISPNATWTNQIYTTYNRPNYEEKDDYTYLDQSQFVAQTIELRLDYQLHLQQGFRSEWTLKNNLNQNWKVGLHYEQSQLETRVQESDQVISASESISLSKQFGPFDNKQRFMAIFSSFHGKKSVWEYEVGGKAMYYFDQNEMMFLPKASIWRHWSNNQSLFFNYERSSQNKHIPYGDFLLFEYPRWIFKEDQESISTSNRFSLGWNTSVWSDWEVNTEVFFQDYNHLSYYEINEDENSYYTLRSNSGKGYNTGLEAVLRRRWPNKANLQIGYTWMKSQRQYEEVNQGRSYRADYGRDHELELQFVFPYKKLLVGVNWTLASGFPYTLPNSKVNSSIWRSYNYISGKNNVNLPLYHRLDLSLSRTLKSKAGRRSIFSFNVFNLYNRFNADHIVPDFNSNTITKISNFGAVPSFYYKLFID